MIYSEQEVQGAMTVREMLNSASDDAIASAILKGAFKKCAYCIYDDTIAYEAGERACPNSPRMP